MIAASIWLTKMILSHLVTDFILQPKAWVEDRNSKHFFSIKLYLHGVITATLAFALTGFQFWKVALIILITHILIDGWKSYRKQTIYYFIIDQMLHMLVIIACWYFTFNLQNDLTFTLHAFNEDPSRWKLLTGIIFITSPAGILIGQFTKQWRDQIENAESLASAGKWIGIAERIIILIFVLFNQYSAIGLLVAAKGIIRFNDKDRPEIKTEYLVIGTLMSIGIAIVTGLIVKM